MAFPNYVPCADLNKDPTFASEASASQECIESHPRKGKSYSEFVLDKNISRPVSGVSPFKKKQYKNASNSETALHIHEGSTTDAAPQHRNSSSNKSGRGGHRSKSSSCLSLNLAWRKSYVPFRGVDSIPVLTADAVVPVGCSEEPLLTPAGQTGPNSPAVEALDYSFDKGGSSSVSGAGGQWTCRGEMSLGNLGLSHPSPHLMVSAQWQQFGRMSCLFLGYRLFWALYFVVWAAWSLIGSYEYTNDWSIKSHYFVYLTNWSIWLLAVDTNLQAANVIRHMRRLANTGGSHYTRAPASFRLSWALSNITFTAHVFITVAYWATVYPFRTDEELTTIGINVHVIPGMYVITNALITAMPCRVLHALYPVMFFLFYIVFNMIYYLLGGTDYVGRVALYPFLDWTQPGRSVLLTTGVLLVLAPIMHALHWAIYGARVRIWRRYRGNRYIREDCPEGKIIKLEEGIV